MLLLQKATANNIVVTLNELKSESLPNNWLFVFELEQDDNYTYRLYLNDISLFPERYNEFTLIEGTDVTFKFNGDYKYKAYQMPDGGSTDESLGLLVETGKMRLKEIETITPTFTADNLTTIHENVI